MFKSRHYTNFNLSATLTFEKGPCVKRTTRFFNVRNNCASLFQNSSNSNKVTDRKKGLTDRQIRWLKHVTLWKSNDLNIYDNFHCHSIKSNVFLKQYLYFPWPLSEKSMIFSMTNSSSYNFQWELSFVHQLKIVTVTDL